jgi:hypothetical protein
MLLSAFEPPSWSSSSCPRARHRSFPFCRLINPWPAHLCSVFAPRGRRWVPGRRVACRSRVPQHWTASCCRTTQPLCARASRVLSIGLRVVVSFVQENAPPLQSNLTASEFCGPPFLWGFQSSTRCASFFLSPSSAIRWTTRSQPHWTTNDPGSGAGWTPGEFEVHT